MNPFRFMDCGRWDLNPHDRIDHKILSLARLPVPTLPQVALSLSEKYNTTPLTKSQHLFIIFLIFFQNIFFDIVECLILTFFGKHFKH